MYRYLFIAVLGGVGGYCWGLVDGAQIADSTAYEARYGS
jgi:hypothetical protein